ALGIIYAIMALGVYISFLVLDFPDLTVDGGFVTGSAVTAIAITNGISPIIASRLGSVCGFLLGCIKGIWHTKGKINAILSGIFMMIALYSINLRILGKPTISLLHETTLFDHLKSIWPERVDSLFNQMFLVMGIDRVHRHGGSYLL